MIENQATVNLSRSEKKNSHNLLSTNNHLIGWLLSSIRERKNRRRLDDLGIVAYLFGLRHGVDADYIAAIDNTTRKLM